MVYIQATACLKLYKKVSHPGCVDFYFQKHNSCLTDALNINRTLKVEHFMKGFCKDSHPSHVKYSHVKSLLWKTLPNEGIHHTKPKWNQNNDFGTITPQLQNSFFLKKKKSPICLKTCLDKFVESCTSLTEFK